VPERTWPNVLAGQTGAVITVLQNLLRTQGYALTPTGTFDATTVAAVQDFQARQGLPPHVLGEMTDATWEALVVPLDTRSTGDAVSGLQAILRRKGHSVTVTGIVDSDTREAVRQMQLLHGLSPTGTVDVTTWCAVVGGVVRDELDRVLRR
jgi:peptidoglycan hydrolase-like protein with peptidoglycan-binding domain